jgi:hypothetical protein
MSSEPKLFAQKFEESELRTTIKDLDSSER